MVRVDYAAGLGRQAGSSGRLGEPGFGEEPGRAAARRPRRAVSPAATPHRPGRRFPATAPCPGEPRAHEDRAIEPAASRAALGKHDAACCFTPLSGRLSSEPSH